jgi:hypothetical protein
MKALSPSYADGTTNHSAMTHTTHMRMSLMPGLIRERETRIMPTTVAPSLTSIQMTATTTAPVASAWSSAVPHVEQWWQA